MTDLEKELYSDLALYLLRAEVIATRLYVKKGGNYKEIRKQILQTRIDLNKIENMEKHDESP